MDSQPSLARALGTKASRHGRLGPYAEPSMIPCAGFTLVELVMTMIIIGILAILALPRFADESAFQTRGFRDETLSLLRYAQKSAVSQRSTVCVTVNSTGVALTIDTNADGTCDASLSLPVTPRGGSGLGGSSFNFLSSGATNGTGTLTLTLTGATNIQIDAVTGYVR